MSGDLPTPEPLVTPETEAFWAASAESRLLLKRCQDCAAVIWYPRAMCPECWSERTEWFEASGRGTIYSCTVNRRGDGPYAGIAPYVLAYVELEEGPRVMTNVVDTEPELVEIGMPVEVVFHDTGHGSALPRFRIAGGDSDGQGGR
jgi:uncharacterized OB-fold protein